jgi:diadenosine tetraphosphate (Ap4A) HIT family hydrolase
MFILPEKRRSRKGPTEIGSPPYYHRSDCFICRKQDGQGHEETPPPGGYIVEGRYFLVEHAPVKMSNAGTVIVESKRHLLDFGEMTSAESAELGSILKRLVPAVKSTTGAPRVYLLALMERAPHFQL